MWSRHGHNPKSSSILATKANTQKQGKMAHLARFERATHGFGGILSAIGGLVTSDQNTEDKIEQLARKLESMGEEIERNTAPKGQFLKSKAEWFCKKFKELDVVEERLRKSIVELQPFNVLETGVGK